MAFTDPPYNVAYGDHGDQQRGTRRRRIANDAMPVEQREAFCRGAGKLLSSVDGALYVCMSSKEWPLDSRVLEEAGGHWSDTIIWAKDRFTLGRADYQREYEPIWYGWRESVNRHRCGDRDQGMSGASRGRRSRSCIPRRSRCRSQSARSRTPPKPGDSVLDLFLGSGTTLIASERTGRVCCAVELDPRYVDVAVLRWEALPASRRSAHDGRAGPLPRHGVCRTLAGG